MRLLSLFIALLLFWLALSGHFTPFLVGAGIASSALCVFAARRMGAADGEAHPLSLFGRALTYFPWLIWEICKSCWAVTRIIVDLRLPIPTVVRWLAYAAGATHVLPDPSRRQAVLGALSGKRAAA